MIGVQVTKSDLNVKGGDIASWLNEYFNQSVEVKNYIDRITVAGLVALGFTQDEADNLKKAFDDLAYMKSQAFDASEAVKKLYGMGIR